MGIKEIVEILSDSKNQKIDSIKITFREGLNIRGIAQIIEEKTNIKSEEFINKVSDKDYIKSIQKDYWFLTDDIYNEKIYYPLEGYLFPDTYEFEKKEIEEKRQEALRNLENWGRDSASVNAEYDKKQKEAVDKL